MTYKINKFAEKDSFSVPAVIADKHLKFASGDAVKVLLLALKNSDRALSTADFAKKLKISESDVEDCLQYWILTGILSDDSSDGQITFDTEPQKYVPGAKREKTPPAAPSLPAAPIEYSRPSPSEIATRIGESKEIANLFTELQKILGKTIGYDGQCTFLLLHDRFGLPPEVIFMLTDYCVSSGKTGYSYIEAVGKSWAENEIDTIDKAAEKIEALGDVDKFWKKFSAAAGLKTPKPTQKQAAFIEKWLKRQNLSLDLILLAYEEMAERTGKLSFAYMDKVLENWYSEGFKKAADVENAKKAGREKSNHSGKSPASYDVDQFNEKGAGKAPVYKRKKK